MAGGQFSGALSKEAAAKLGSIASRALLTAARKAGVELGAQEANAINAEVSATAADLITKALSNPQNLNKLASEATTQSLKAAAPEMTESAAISMGSKLWELTQRGVNYTANYYKDYAKTLPSQVEKTVLVGAPLSGAGVALYEGLKLVGAFEPNSPYKNVAEQVTGSGQAHANAEIKALVEKALEENQELKQVIEKQSQNSQQLQEVNQQLQQKLDGATDTILELTETLKAQGLSVPNLAEKIQAQTLTQTKPLTQTKLEELDVNKSTDKLNNGPKIGGV